MIFLHKTEVLELHRRLLTEFGGSAGMLNEGALESALIAAENRHYYEEADGVACAAAYGYHLTQAHAFIDGNKRVGAAAMEVFLLLNGMRIEAEDDELYDLIMSIAEGGCSRVMVETWLRGKTAPINQ